MTVKRDITKIIDDFDVPDGRNVQADLSVLALAFLRGAIDADDFMEEDVFKIIGLDLSRREEAVRYARQLCANLDDFAVWAFDAAAHYQTIQLLNQE